MAEPIDPKSAFYNGIVVGVPTFGMVNINFSMSLNMLSSPVFTSKTLLPVIGKPVDVARNEICAAAIFNQYGFVFFRDDDVITETDALVRLMARMSPKQRSKPRDNAEAIVGGVVYSKTRPPSPMIHRKDCVGGFEDWNYGDLVECDAIGMGCTLIPVGVLNKVVDTIEEYQCINHNCQVNWTQIYGKDQDVCPSCKMKLVPMFFRTVRSELSGEVMHGMTEDSFFCRKAQAVGTKIYADAGVQCQHQCNDTATSFYYHRGLGLPVWESEGNFEFVPPTGSELLQKAKFEPKSNGKKNGKLRFNVGCGGDRRKGWVNIDVSPVIPCDEVCDIRDLKPVVMKLGQADEIMANHVLEHINRTAVPVTVRNWVKALKPGGKLKIEVPDARWAMENFLHHDANGSKQIEKDFSEAVVFGAQRYPYDEHRAAITKNRIEGILRSIKSLERYAVKVTHPKTKNQQVIRITAIKKKETV